MSGRKANLVQTQLAAAVNLSSSTVYYTDPVNIQHLDNVGLQFVWTPTLTGGNMRGTMSVLASVDYQAVATLASTASTGNFVKSAGHFVQYVGSTAIAAAIASSGSSIADINQCPFPWIRGVYAATSGTGTLDVWMSAKQT